MRVSRSKRLVRRSRELSENVRGEIGRIATGESGAIVETLGEVRRGGGGEEESGGVRGKATMCL